MESLPTEFWALGALAFVLGLKHGFDADHLATIDGLTRHNTAAGSPFARWCGTLFSAGHGAIVTAIAVGASLIAGRASAPDWLETFGTTVSVAFLLVLGLLNLLAVLRTEPTQVVAPIGIKGTLLGRFTRASGPLGVAAVGALFALSFDTVSQAMLFAIAATHANAPLLALVAALLFTAGMMVTDGLNGLWVAKLIRRADRTALIASRIMALAVAAISFLVAGLGIARVLLPSVDAWSDHHSLALGAAIVIAIVGALLLGRAASRPAPQASRI